MICQLCGKDEKLVRSHIIPKSFFKDAHPNNDALMVSKDDYSKRVRIGVYDKEILCDGCERKFIWDDYGNEFFNKIIESNAGRKISRGEVEFTLYDCIDYKRLKLFLISVLWRGGVCKESFFSEIKLGSFDEKLREMILSVEPGGVDDFSVLIFKYNINTKDILCPPAKTRLDNGVNGYRLFFYNAEVFIKVDKQRISNMESILLAPDKPVVVIKKDPLTVVSELNKLRGDDGEKK